MTLSGYKVYMMSMVYGERNGLNQKNKKIKNKKSYYQAILSFLILNVINNKPTINRLMDYWGNQISDSKFRQDPIVRQIIDFDKEKIMLRSSVAAKYMLQNAANIGSI